jgi:hypothetical protein
MSQVQVAKDAGYEQPAGPKDNRPPAGSAGHAMSQAMAAAPDLTATEGER